MSFEACGAKKKNAAFRYSLVLVLIKEGFRSHLLLFKASNWQQFSVNYRLIQRNEQWAIQSLNEADVYIKPDISSIPVGTGDFELGREAYDPGVNAAVAKSQQLARYRVDDALWNGYIGSLRNATTRPEKIECIQLNDFSNLPDALLKTQIESDAISNYRAVMSLLRTEVNSFGADWKITYCAL